MRRGGVSAAEGEELGHRHEPVALGGQVTQDQRKRLPGRLARRVHDVHEHDVARAHVLHHVGPHRLGVVGDEDEAVRLAAEHVGGRGLIVVPLGVRQEFRRDAVERLGWPEAPRFIRRIEEAAGTGVYLTNYETVRDGKLDPREFQAASLDEASVLRGFGGTKTFREFMALFAGDDRRDRAARVKSEGIRFRFVATAIQSALNALVPGSAE